MNAATEGLMSFIVVLGEGSIVELDDAVDRLLSDDLVSVRYFEEELTVLEVALGVVVILHCLDPSNDAWYGLHGLYCLYGLNECLALFREEVESVTCSLFESILLAVQQVLY